MVGMSMEGQRGQLILYAVLFVYGTVHLTMARRLIGSAYGDYIVALSLDAWCTRINGLASSFGVYMCLVRDSTKVLPPLMMSLHE